MLRHWVRVIVIVGAVLAGERGWAGEPSQEGDGRMWGQMIVGAAKLRLPTGFLKEMPADFVRFEFDDLRTYAAEYHPGEHRMVLNRTLSFHAAGRDLRPLASMTHKELELLYHELFHAYMDYLEFEEGLSADQGGAQVSDLLRFARAMQVCRYREVAITPVVQRSRETEVRYLSDSEAWEALNETWAVFIGWGIWNQLEVEKKRGRSMVSSVLLSEEWGERLRRAGELGELRGYYVPQDPDERRVAQKRFLGGASQISVEEVRYLMQQVLGLPEKFTESAIAGLRQLKNFPRMPVCS